MGLFDSGERKTKPCLQQWIEGREPTGFGLSLLCLLLPSVLLREAQTLPRALGSQPVLTTAPTPKNAHLWEVVHMATHGA